MSIKAERLRIYCPSERPAHTGGDTSVVLSREWNYAVSVNSRSWHTAHSPDRWRVHAIASYASS